MSSNLIFIERHTKGRRIKDANKKRKKASANGGASPIDHLRIGEAALQMIVLATIARMAR
jgi:hypothetical protein